MTTSFGEYTGFFVKDGEIHGPEGVTGVTLDSEGVLRRGTEVLECDVEDGFFYRVTWKFWIIRIYEPSGHRIDEKGRVLGDRETVPWQLQVRRNKGADKYWKLRLKRFLEKLLNPKS